MGGDLTLWDSTAPAAAGAGLVYCWNGYVESEGVYSVLQYVERHGERLRLRYLEWIHDLGETHLRGRRLIDLLSLGEGFSFWWMTPLVEKSPWKTPAIVDAIRLLALEEILRERRPDAVRLASGNSRLRQAVAVLCGNLKIPFQSAAVPGELPRRRTLTELYRRLPQPAQALIGIARHLRTRWPLRRNGPPAGWRGGEHARFFCSYFVHLDQKSALQGRFHSRQWESLPQLVQDSGGFANWLQHFEPHGSVPDAGVANDLLRRFNADAAGQAAHAFVDSFLSWPMVFRVLKRWLGFNLLHWRLHGVRHAFQPRGSHVSLWPLMRGDWHASLCGPLALINLLWMELFDRALGALPRQLQGLYLFEGQGWERAFIHAWRKHGHGQLIAMAHSTVRFWDLRNFCDPRTLRAGGPCALPQPDLIALNGKVAVEAYASVGFPPAAITECEAVRFTYLNDLPPRQPAAKKAFGPPKVLVLGDIMKGSTRSVLKLLEAAIPLVPVRPVCTVKPHPNCQVEAADYPNLQAQIVANPLSEILQNFDIAISANLTSAAVDAYLAGLFVIVVLDGSGLNFSPLRGLPGVCFISTAGELAEALRTIDCGAASAAARDAFFFLDPQLPRWRRLLDVATGVPTMKEVSSRVR